jgi:drug/metabolite transporter (DMT)-like permease
MTEILALGSALAFGAGDFLGGTASRIASPLRVTAVAQVASAVALVPMVLLVPAPDVTAPDVLWGAIGGLLGLVGLLLLFIGLSQGPMGVVAPITAVVSAVVPVAWGLVTGERPGPVAGIGIVLGLLAVAIVSVSDGPAGRLTGRLLAVALGAGLGFALFFVALGETSLDAGLWPLVGARAVTVPVILVVALVRAGDRAVRPVWILAVGSGVLDMTANALFLSAAQRGLLAIAAVLAALYPAATAVLARLFHGERMSRPQLVGVGAAVMAVVLIGLPV